MCRKCSNEHMNGLLASDKNKRSACLKWLILERVLRVFVSFRLFIKVSFGICIDSTVMVMVIYNEDDNQIQN